MIEKVKPNMFGPLTDKFPSVYPRGQSVELPGWIMFDKQASIYTITKEIGRNY